MASHAPPPLPGAPTHPGYGLATAHAQTAAMPAMPSRETVTRKRRDATRGKGVRRGCERAMAVVWKRMERVDGCFEATPKGLAKLVAAVGALSLLRAMFPKAFKWAERFVATALFVPAVGVTAPLSLAVPMATRAVAAPVIRAVSPGTHRMFRYLGLTLPIYTRYQLTRVRARRIADAAERAAMWDRVHEWAAPKVGHVSDVLGGYFPKVGQIMGTASQMMPKCYVDIFASTMDNNPPSHVRKIIRTIESSFGMPVGAIFKSFDPKPAATASIAQVHFGVLKDGTHVAVKVQIPGCEKKMRRDLTMLSKTAHVLKASGMDGGMDMPNVVDAYMRVVPAEFDFRLEAAAIRAAKRAMEEEGLEDKVALPEPVEPFIAKRCFIMKRMYGLKLLDSFNDARKNGVDPAAAPAPEAANADGHPPPVPNAAICPPEVDRVHGRGQGWYGVMRTVHQVWGRTTLIDGAFHTDPHPGNLILTTDGKLGILDWGQRAYLRRPQRLQLARIVIALASEDYELAARLTMASGSFDLEVPCKEAFTAFALTYFDTRPSPLANLNVFDLDNSPLANNGLKKSTPSAFLLVRVSFLIRGLMEQLRVESSMAYTWEGIARRALRLYANGDEAVTGTSGFHDVAVAIDEKDDGIAPAEPSCSSTAVAATPAPVANVTALAPVVGVTPASIAAIRRVLLTFWLYQRWFLRQWRATSLLHVLRRAMFGKEKALRGVEGWWPLDSEDMKELMRRQTPCLPNPEDYPPNSTKETSVVLPSGVSTLEYDPQDGAAKGAPSWM